MKKYIGIGALVLVALWGISAYNGLVGVEESVKTAWGKVESQYQRRADLIPNLVNTVKGAAENEKGILVDVIEARSKATQTIIDPSKITPEMMKKFQAAQGEFSSAISRLLVTVERYPDIKSNQNFLELQSQLEGTENRITVARDRFNEAVEPYNVKLRNFPTVIIAKILGFQEKGRFESQPGSDVAPTVQF